MPKVTLHEGDNRISLKRLADNSIHAVLTDTPYGLTSMNDRFAAKGAKPARKETNDGSFARLGAGFMQKSWDGSGIERDPQFWAEVLRVLMPGGYLVAFSGSRTYHRMAAAIEAAGFIIHPMIGWLNGQGFPKAHASDKAIDKLLGKQGEIIPAGTPVKRMIPGADQNKIGWEKNNGREYQPGAYVPATDEAAEWQGWAYGGQVRKPALEPICVAQKPFSEKSGAANLLRWGVGAVNVDGCRVPGAVTTNPRVRNASGGYGSTGLVQGETGKGKHSEGRHPANLIHDGSPEVVALFPHTKSGKPGVMRKGSNDGACYGAESRAPGTPMTGFGDEGSAARFFESYPFDGQPAFYHPKAGKDDRAGSNHPTVKPIALMAALIRHITPPGGVVLDPFAGSGTTAEAARREGFDCILMEAEAEYIDFLNERFGLRRDELSAFSDLL